MFQRSRRIEECAPQSQDKPGPQEGSDVAGVIRALECISCLCLSSRICKDDHLHLETASATAAPFLLLFLSLLPQLCR